MKKSISHFGCILYILMANVLYAQPLGKETGQKPEVVASSRNLIMAYQARTVSWWDSGNGFICKYSVNNRNYMARYDTRGNYVETLIQKEWDDRVSPSLQSSVQRSQYKSQKITSYWEVMEPQKKGYYLEFNSVGNRLVSVWADDQGNFSMVPGSSPKH